MTCDPLFYQATTMRESAFAIALVPALAAASFAQTPAPTSQPQETPAAPITQETLTESAIYKFPVTGQEVFVSKVFDLPNQKFVVKYTDANGRPANLAEFRAAEALARASNPEVKIEPALVEAMNAKPTEGQEIILWLSSDTTEIERLRAEIEGAVDIDSMLEPELEAIERELGEATARIVKAQNAPVAARLKDAGIQVRYVSSTIPMIAVTATAAQIEALSQWEEVDTVYVDGTAEDHMDVANAAHYTNYLTNAGLNASGIRAAVLENNGVDPAHPNLTVTEWFNPLSPNPDIHVQGTSGCIASTRPDRIGSANGVSLYSANAASYSMTNITAAADWITTRNIDVTNNSWGGGSSTAGFDYFSRMFDYQSRFYQDSYVASAGNGGLGNNVGRPGAAWNIITAGSFDDSGTASWGDDSMSSFSSTGDAATGCQKPNVVASGTCIDTLGLAPTWIRDCYDGTSFSSPFVTGTVAHLMKADFTARWSPEAAMAGVMASAWHNVEGASRLSDQDGAGAIHTLAAHNMGEANRVRAVTLNSGSFDPAREYRYPIRIRRGAKTRVCIAWSANGVSDYSSNSLDADLDLIVEYPAAMVSIAASLSTFNNYEIVEFVAPFSGTYNVVIRAQQFDGTSERVGICWSFWNDQCAVPGGTFLCAAPGKEPLPNDPIRIFFGSSLTAYFSAGSEFDELALGSAA